MHMAFSWQEYWNGLPFPPPVDCVSSEHFTVTHPWCPYMDDSWHDFIGLCKPLHHDNVVTHEGVGDKTMVQKDLSWLKGKAGPTRFTFNGSAVLCWVLCILLPRKFSNKNYHAISEDQRASSSRVSASESDLLRQVSTPMSLSLPTT